MSESNDNEDETVFDAIRREARERERDELERQRRIQEMYERQNQ
jgi:hypothetical protein